ncbi:DUF2141 domain-containing protein [Marinimicrobium sp. ABcell2]|uniref:DUF2141 domain-containing protein n=1 Tax=Marinimicrobium sp. ABcell2 TaxID=3069751 RepID=UPI0027B064A2|nr:DUF2141 domain-containing protein [Marinimicrobium sp. ABcell2]MDQ2076990.1 DUF2141 domain-containing protein [Marinimicrobium sp. ABcell2]
MRTVLLLILLVFARVSGASEPYQLTVEGNRSPGADLYVAVYPERARSWDAEPLVQLRHVLPESSVFTIDLPLDPGAYAIRAFVDLSGDGELATGERGRPIEPFAISVGEGRRQPSMHFRRSVFLLSDDQPEVTLTLRYPEAASNH